MINFPKNPLLKSDTKSKNMNESCEKCERNIPKITYKNNKGDLESVPNTERQCHHCGHRNTKVSRLHDTDLEKY